MQEAELATVMDELLAAAQAEADSARQPGCTSPTGIPIGCVQHLLTHLHVFNWSTTFGSHSMITPGICQGTSTFLSVNPPEMVLAKCAFHFTASFTFAFLIRACLCLESCRAAEALWPCLSQRFGPPQRPLLSRVPSGKQYEEDGTL